MIDARAGAQGAPIDPAVRVARLALDEFERQGAAAVSLIQSAGKVASPGSRGAVSPTPGIGEPGQRLNVAG